MANVFVTIPVPPSGTGPAIDVSTFAREKTLASQGPDGSLVVIEGSSDGGLTFAPIGSVRPLPNPATIKISLALTHMRARNIGVVGAISLAVGAELAAENLFINVPVGGAPADVSLIEEEEKSIVITGEYSGALVLDVSEDGVVFNSVKSFDTGSGDAVRLIGTFRSIRARLVSGTGSPKVMVGGDQGTPGGGVESFMAENVTNASGGDLVKGNVVRISANDAVALSRSDVPANLQGTIGVTLEALPTGEIGPVVTSGKATVLMEAGLVPSPIAGDTIFVSEFVFGRGSNVSASNLYCLGVVKDASRYAVDSTVIGDIVPDCRIMPTTGVFPGFGSAPPNVESESSSGSSGLASRNDHTHGGIASWAIGSPRYYAVDNDGGNDSNLGFSDVSMAAAVAVAKKTWGALLSIIPTVGAGRIVVVAIVPRAGGATYLNAALTVDDLVWRGFVGYRYASRVATDAGVNNLADKIKSGGIDATGLGVLTVAAVPVPASGVFAATVALPTGLKGRRVRFLTGTQTNQAAVLHQQTTTALANDTVTLGTNITGAPAAGDTFMIERCGVAFNRVAIGLDSTAMENRPEFSVARAGDVTRGIAAKSTAAVSFDMRGPATQVAIGFCEDDGAGASGTAIDGPTTLVMTGSVRDETGTNIKVGSSLRTSGSGPPSITNVTSLAYSNSAFQGTGSPFFFNVSQALVLGAGSTWAVGARFDGCFGSLIDPPEPGANIGNGSLASPSRRLHITGTAAAALAGLEIRCNAAVRGVEIINQGAKPALTLGASAAGYDINDVVGSTGNTDVGIAVAGTGNSVKIGRIEAVTVAGTLGDIRISSGAIATYAGLALTNVVDNVGNDISGSLGKVVSESILVTNASGVTLDIGNIVRTTGVSGEVTRSLADTAANAGGDLLVMTTTPLNTALGYAVPFGSPAWVTFDAAPTPNVLSYLDESAAGLATQVVPPQAATNQKRRLGSPLRISGTLGLMTAAPEIIPITSDGVSP